MSAMEFQYLYDPPEIGRALVQAVGAAAMCWDNVDGAGEFNVEKALEIAQAASVEVRRIITLHLAQMLDGAGVATEWNEAIEASISHIEALS